MKTENISQNFFHLDSQLKIFGIFDEKESGPDCKVCYRQKVLPDWEEYTSFGTFINLFLDFAFAFLQQQNSNS